VGATVGVDVVFGVADELDGPEQAARAILPRSAHATNVNPRNRRAAIITSPA